VQLRLQLQAAGCRYRIEQTTRSPYIQVYETQPPRRQQAARGFRMEDEQACRYVSEERAEHKLAHLLRQRDLDEGRSDGSPGGGSPATQPAGAAAALPAGLTPELIALARKLKAAGLG
jgi:hypothetical protein